jgi:hypothetical protein
VAIMDVFPIQDWISAFDTFDRAERRLNAAHATGHAALIEELQKDRERAAVALNSALKRLKDA